MSNLTVDQKLEMSLEDITKHTKKAVNASEVITKKPIKQVMIRKPLPKEPKEPKERKIKVCVIASADSFVTMTVKCR